MQNNEVVVTLIEEVDRKQKRRMLSHVSVNEIDMNLMHFYQILVY